MCMCVHACKDTMCILHIHVHVHVQGTYMCQCGAVIVYIVVNPQHACAARVTVLGLYVCLSVCPLKGVFSTNALLNSLSA